MRLHAADEVAKLFFIGCCREHSRNLVNCNGSGSRAIDPVVERLLLRCALSLITTRQLRCVITGRPVGQALKHGLKRDEEHCDQHGECFRIARHLRDSSRYGCSGRAVGRRCRALDGEEG